MTLLTPLGLIALSSIVALIIIYIIRPNFQQKIISTTFVWKLSLKYRKKRIPTSKLRNLILILCQVLILAACAGILTTPARVIKAIPENDEVIIIVDSSASMLTENSDGATRYKRALNLAGVKIKEVFDGGGMVSMLVADDNPRFVFTGIEKENRTTAEDALYALEIENACSYGSADIPAAIEMCSDIFLDNPNAEIYVYTDSLYTSDPPKGINVVNVGERAEEWNAAILNATAEKVNGYYMFIVEVACYNQNRAVPLYMSITGANANANSAGQNFSAFVTVDCVIDRTMTVVFGSDSVHSFEMNNYATQEDTVVVATEFTADSYKSINLFLDVTDDSLNIDNSYNIYGGFAEPIKAEYFSSENNPFINSALDSMRNTFLIENRWELSVAEKSTNIETVGYDFYIFEDVMPSVLPTDGIVFLINPDVAPMLSGFSVRGGVTVSGGKSLSLSYGDNDRHPLLKNIRPDGITVSQFMNIDNSAGEYEVLLKCDKYPVLMVKKEGGVQIVVMAFSLHYSNFSQKLDFPLFMLGLFDYFCPSTVDKYGVEVGEKISVNARSPELNVKGDDVDYNISDFPTDISFDAPGSYELMQRTYFSKQVTDMIYVKSPRKESEIFREEESLTNPYSTVDESDFFDDLLLYLAIALTALSFVEWILQARDNM